MANPYNYSGTGGILAGSNTGFMPSLTGSGGGGIEKAARAGLGIATGGASEIITQLINLVPSIFQGIIGGSQLKKAERIEEQYPRPTAEVAPSVEKLVNYSYGRTLRQDIPGGDIARGEIKGATAAGMRAASELGSGAEAYGMLGELVGREQNSFADLAKLTAQQTAGYEGQYMDTLSQKAGEENRVWEWNKAQPYMMAAQVAQQLRDSGMKNLYSGTANVFGSTAEAVSPDLNSTLINGMGNKKGVGNVSNDELMQIIRSLTGGKG